MWLWLWLHCGNWVVCLTVSLWELTSVFDCERFPQEFKGECKIAEILFLQVGFHGWIFAIYFVIVRVPFRVFRNSYFPLMCSFRSLWSRLSFDVEVITIGGGLPSFLGASCSGGAFSASGLYVSVSSSGRCEEVASWHCLWRQLVGILGCLWSIMRDMPLASIHLPEVVVLGRSYHYVLFGAPLCPACALTLRTTFRCFSVTVLMP
jgi:hypothetical protein